MVGIYKDEIDKWITVSRQRFKKITTNDNGDLYVRIAGNNKETINVGFVNVKMPISVLRIKI